MAQSNQALFNKVLRGMRKQGRPAVDDNNRCLYKTKDGYKCSGGFLITKKQYVEDMEGCTVDIVPYFVDKYYPQLRFIRSMQRAHDISANNMGHTGINNKKFIKCFNKRMKYIAKEYTLIYKEVS